MAGSLLPVFPSANPYFEPVVPAPGRESAGVGLTYRLLPGSVKTNWVCLFETMIAKPKSAASPPLFFPDWAARLGADGSLTPGLREGYRQTLTGFLAFCRQRRAQTSVSAARDFVELTRLERAPSPGRLQEWKDALNWYFRRGRESAAVAMKGVPPLARSDLGKSGWEQGLIARLRRKECSWRTEQTYRGWLWRFARFLGKRPVEAAGGAVA
jgi:hypothetical protein